MLDLLVFSEEIKDSVFSDDWEFMLVGSWLSHWATTPVDSDDFLEEERIRLTKELEVTYSHRDYFLGLTALLERIGEYKVVCVQDKVALSVTREYFNRTKTFSFD